MHVPLLSLPLRSAAATDRGSANYAAWRAVCATAVPLAYGEWRSLWLGVRRCAPAHRVLPGVRKASPCTESPDLLPGQCQPLLFVLIDAAFRRPHQIRYLPFPHLCQGCFRRDPPIHHPHTPRLPVGLFRSGPETAAAFCSTCCHPSLRKPAKNPSGVTINAITTCTQSGRLSRL